jgi:hypothetical protein
LPASALGRESFKPNTLLPNPPLANVAAFLTGGLAGTYPEIVGEPYRNGDGRLYTPMIREPIFIYGATSAELTRTHGRGIQWGAHSKMCLPLHAGTESLRTRRWRKADSNSWSHMWMRVSLGKTGRK